MRFTRDQVDDRIKKAIHRYLLWSRIMASVTFLLGVSVGVTIAFLVRFPVYVIQ